MSSQHLPPRVPLLSAVIASILPVTSAFAGAPGLSYQESFESAASGSPPSYLGSFFVDSNDYFQRVKVSGTSSDPTPLGFGGVTGTPVSGQDGNWVIVSEDVNDGGNPLATYSVIRLNDITVTGFQNLQITVGLGTHVAWNSSWETNKNIRIEYAFDGAGGGTGGGVGSLSSSGYSIAGQFFGNGTSLGTEGGFSDGPALDGNMNGAYDAADTTLIPSDGSMQDFVFEVSGTGTTLSVQVVVDNTAGSEELLIDNIRVTGEVAAGDPPVLANIEGTAANWTEGGPATPVSGTITVTDNDSNIESATVTIQSGYNQGQDVLSINGTLPGGITGAFNAPFGTMTLTGSASPANYQAALRQVEFSNTSSNPNLFETRTIRFQVNDGNTNSNTQSRNLMVTGVVASATIPYLEDFSTDGNGVRYTANSFTDGQATPQDYFEWTTANPHPGHSAAYTFNAPQAGGYFASEDVDDEDNPLGPGQPAIIRLPDLAAAGLGNLRVSVYLADNNNGSNLDGGEKIEIQAAFDGNTGGTDLAGGTYTTYGRYVGDAASMAMREDTNLDGSSSDPADSSSRVLTSTMTKHTFNILGTGNTLSVQVAIANTSGTEEIAIDHIEVTGDPVGPPPVLANIEGSAADFTEGDGPLQITNSITATDADSTNLEGAIIQIAGNHQPGEDVLAVNGSLPAGITAELFDSGTGRLVIFGTAPIADYQAALRQITYQNTHPTNPDVCDRTIVFQVFDPTGGSNLAPRNIRIIGVVPPSEAPYLEDFDTDGDGTRYTSNSFSDGQAIPQDYFVRTDANPYPGHGPLIFTAPQANGFWTSEDVDAPGNKLGDHGIVRLRELKMTGFTNRAVQIFLAGHGNPLDTTEQIEIQYAYDGNSGGTDLSTGTYTTIGRFINNGGTLRQDSDLDGLSSDPEDATSPVLTDTMAEYTFVLPDTGDILSLQVKVTGTSGTENISFDHINVNGTALVETVVNADDAGPGSLRQAIADSVPGTTILFDPGLNGETITLTSGQLSINQELTIDGSALDRGITISGGGASRVMNVASGGNVTLECLTVADGSFPSGFGGGIFNTGNLVVRNCALVNNMGFGGGAISNTTAGAALQVINSTITANTAIFGGAVLHRDGDFHLVHSTITGNTGTSGTGAFVLERGTATIENSIVAGNRGTASHDFGGILTTITVLGSNLIGTNNGNYAGFFPADGILVGTIAAPVDPRLAPFSHYGGCTGTMHPLAGSPAFDRGIVTADTPTTDQRGLPRNVGFSPDLGALEGGPAALVSSTGDSGPGSLRQAITDAVGNPGTRIYFDLTIFPSPTPITLTTALGQLNLSGQLLFLDGSEIAGGVEVSGDDTVRIFNLDGGSALGLVNLVLRDGNPLSSPNSDSGAIRLAGSSCATLLDCAVTDSVSQSRAGAIGVHAGSALDAIRSDFSSNASGGDNGGGAICNDGAGASVLLTDCTFTNNSSPTTAGAVHTINGASLTARGCYFSGNAAIDAGAIHITNSGPLVLENCTFENNTATGEGGALLATGDNYNATVRHCTITGNGAGTGGSGPGGGIRKADAGSLTLENSLVSGNTAPGGPDIQGAITAHGGVNLIGDTAGAGGIGTEGTDYIVAPAQLAPASQYGGPTPSMPPLPASAAVDAGGVLSSAPPTDQRGFDRPQGSAPDIGAVERAALFVDNGPYLINDTDFPLTSTVSRDDTAGDTLYFQFTVNPLSDYTVESYFAGFQLFDAGTERFGIGNGFNPWAYSAYNTPGGSGFVDLNSANPDAAQGYEYVRSGVVRTIVFRVDFVPGGNDQVRVWLAPDLSLIEAAQAPVLLTAFTADATFDEVQLREGGGIGGGWNFSELQISELSPFGDLVTFAGLFPGLDPNGDENGDGLSNFFHYASGDDPTNPTSLPALNGNLYTHTTRINGSDVFLDYEYSLGLTSFTPMLEGVHYQVDTTSDTGPNVQSITIELLFDPTIDPRVFWRHTFGAGPP